MRWLTLLSMAVAASMSGAMSMAVILVLIFAAVWNIFLTVASVFIRKVQFYRLINLIGDIAIASFLFYFGGNVIGNFQWAGVLPVISGALYYQWWGGTLLTVVIVLIQGLLMLVAQQQTQVMLIFAALSPVYLVIGLGVGYISLHMNRQLDRAKRKQAAQQQEWENRERDRSRTIYRLISQLSTSLNYQRVLDMALDAANGSLNSMTSGDDSLISAVYLYARAETGEAQLQLASARRYTPNDLRVILHGVEGVLGQAIDDRQSKLLKEPSQDPELSRIIALRNCHSAYCIPLRSGLDIYGVLLFAHPAVSYFTVDRCEILDVIANQAMVAFQNARLYHELEVEKERITVIQEDARRKLARDLHDGPTQSVAALAMRTNFARRLIEKDVHAASEELYKIEDLARRTTKEIRHMLFTLRPLVLESQGLVMALQAMAQKMHETFGQEVIVEADAELVSDLETGKQSVIFYIAEEAVNNARKHAQAPHIWIRLKPAGQDMVVLEIEDDGVGFNLETVQDSYENRGSMGLLNMRERAELVNGILQVESSSGSGTQIRVYIPLSEDAADHLRRAR